MVIRAVAVIGAGTMGAGIAQVCAQAGWDTRLIDSFSESLERGMASIEEFWNKGIELGKTSASVDFIHVPGHDEITPNTTKESEPDGTDPPQGTRA